MRNIYHEYLMRRTGPGIRYCRSPVYPSQAHRIASGHNGGLSEWISDPGNNSDVNLIAASASDSIIAYPHSATQLYPGLLVVE